MILIFFHQYSVVLVGWDGGNWSERGRGGVGVELGWVGLGWVAYM